MRLRKHLAAAAVALLAAVGIVVGVQAPAFANAVGNSALAGPDNRGTGGYYVDYSADTIAVTVQPYILQSGYCLTIYVDIIRTFNVPSGYGGHYDVRAARSCKSNLGRSSGTQYENLLSGIDITGVQKLAVCYGLLNELGTCKTYVGSVATVDPNFDSNAKCSRSWTVSQSGGVFYWGGGDSRYCGS